MSKLVKKDSRWIGRDKTRFQKGVEQDLITHQKCRNTVWNHGKLANEHAQFVERIIYRRGPILGRFTSRAKRSARLHDMHKGCFDLFYGVVNAVSSIPKNQASSIIHKIWALFLEPCVCPNQIFLKKIPQNPVTCSSNLAKSEVPDLTKSWLGNAQVSKALVLRTEDCFLLRRSFPNRFKHQQSGQDWNPKSQFRKSQAEDLQLLLFLRTAMGVSAHSWAMGVVSIPSWLVVEPPLWKIWVRQLGVYCSQ